MQYEEIQELRKRPLTKEEIEFQIEERRKRIRQMVGQLYPSILYDEIQELAVMKVKQ